MVAPKGLDGRAAEIHTARGHVGFGQSILRLAADGESEEVQEISGGTLPDGVVEVCSPMAGTLYHQSSPGAPAFAPVGAEVSVQSTVALVEVMKSLNPVRTDVPGHIERWLVDNGEAVAAGQALLWVRQGPQSL